MFYFFKKENYVQSLIWSYGLVIRLFFFTVCSLLSSANRTKNMRGKRLQRVCDSDRTLRDRNWITSFLLDLQTEAERAEKWQYEMAGTWGSDVKQWRRKKMWGRAPVRLERWDTIIQNEYCSASVSTSRSFFFFLLCSWWSSWRGRVGQRNRMERGHNLFSMHTMRGGELERRTHKDN